MDPTQDNKEAEAKEEEVKLDPTIDINGKHRCLMFI